MTELSPDTQVVLLLCSHFGAKQHDAASPLSPKEYGALVQWLRTRDMRPSNLLDSEFAGELNNLTQAQLESTRVKQLLARGAALALATEKWLRSGLWIISRSDEQYPRRLKKLLGQHSPVLLYGAGRLSLLDGGGLAIVGSRNADEEALTFTRRVAQCCASARLSVISGGAKGIDSAAMQGATEGSGLAIGVLSEGLLRASVVRQNREGIENEQLVLMSPFNPEAGFNAGNAMARNRYIYALSDYALVVASDVGKGGTWAGASENLKNRWVPLYVRPSTVAGNRQLLELGAIAFQFEEGGAQNIRDYLVVMSPSEQIRVDARESVDLFEATGTATVSVESSAASTLAVPVLESSNASQTPETLAPSNTSPANSLDLYGAFTIALRGALNARPLTAREVQDCLRIEASQAKVWLKRAEEDGLIVKRGRPSVYTLALL